jgi:hypothetical protein
MTHVANPTTDQILGGHVKMHDGQWYASEWHVGYAQGPMDTSDNFVTREEAEAKFQARLEDLRKGWGHHGGRFTETVFDRPRGGKAIRFRSVLKTGKPGRLTGLLYMDPMGPSRTA